MKRPYAPPELRRLELDQLGAEARAWIAKERAMAKNRSRMHLSLTWTATTQLVAMVVHEDKRLALLMNPNLPGTPGEWSVMAVVMPATVQTAQGVLDDHSHKIVGVYPSLGLAFTAAEGFARAWAKHFKATETEKCGCDEVT